MKVVDNKIVEATEIELYHHYLSCDYDDVMDFEMYICLCQKAGTNIIKKDVEKCLTKK